MWLSILFSIQVFAKPVLNEGPKEIIEKAHNLVIQDERGAAIQMLVSAIRRESERSKAAIEMKKALAEITQVFMGSQAQQLYELSVSLENSDQNQAQQKVQEALKLEPQNSILINQTARLMILRGDCGSARDYLKKELEKNPYDELCKLILAQAALCLQNIPDYTAIRSAAQTQGGYLREWKALEIERAIIEKSDSRMKENLVALERIDSKHPEISRWNFIIEKKQEKKKVYGEKYVQICREMTPALTRKYIHEVFVCRKATEVAEAILLK